MVSAQQKMKLGVKTTLIDSVLGILRLKKEPSKVTQLDKTAESEFLKHDNIRHHAQVNLRFKLH